MGLTANSVGKCAIDGGLHIEKRSRDDIVVAVAGNPNVGKSTVFNALTGMKQHTGNWPGKTVSNAQGEYRSQKHRYILVDIPGTYSLLAHSQEEEVARNFLCFADPNITLIVCDATCLERNLNLVLQILEIAQKPILCVNLLDEAKRKGIAVDLEKLSSLLGVPVVGSVAQKKGGLTKLKRAMDDLAEQNKERSFCKAEYPPELQEAISTVANVLPITNLPREWLALKLLEGEPGLLHEIHAYLGKNLLQDEAICKALQEARENLTVPLEATVVAAIYQKAEAIAKAVVTVKQNAVTDRDRKIDRMLTGKALGIPTMLLLLFGIFWLTMVGANIPSEYLTSLFSALGIFLSQLLQAVHTPIWLQSLLMDGVYNVLTGVVSVMLPPMAIFFPLFTLLEDIGYLPRVAYNLDRPFACCKACGKQALSMCMGFGCNAAGVVGCRIIDSPRERLIAILTNSFVPCNGRFPMLVTLIGVFLLTGSGYSSILSALLLTGCILLGIGMTFAVSALLSATILRGYPSSFVLELPPYRKPQFGKVIVRSIFDRTLFVLGRAAAVAAPAGLVLWGLSHLYIGESSILLHIATALDPIGTFLGMDGAILIAFLLGFPANEIVLPILVMIYLAEGNLSTLPTLPEIRDLFLQHGWTVKTAICTLLLGLFHFPCSTTVLTIKKETGDWKWTMLAILLPTAVGVLLCAIVAHL